MLRLLIGGARSGKSTLALELARRHRGEVLFVATAEARDEEMAARIARHQAQRPAGWGLVEEPTELEAVIGAASRDAFVVVDCLTLWVANLLEAGLRSDEVAAVSQACAETASRRSGTTVVVTNEVGLGVVPATPLGRRYRDALGEVNACWAAEADEAHFVVAGCLLPLARPRDGVGR